MKSEGGEFAVVLDKIESDSKIKVGLIFIH